MHNIKFLTLNIRGINDQNKANFLKDYLGTSGVDICFIQETHIDSSDTVDELGNLFVDFFCYFTIRFDKTKGVGILVKKNLCANMSVLSTHYDLDSRFLRVEIKINEVILNLINIYAPNVESEQLNFINNMYEVCSNVKNIIMAGDFNAVSKAKDRIGSRIKNLKKYEIEWNCFFKNNNLLESEYEKMDLKNEEKMTWTNNEVSSRIDKLYYSKELKIKCKYYDIRETSKSDHKAVFINCKILEIVKKKENISKFRPWRLNNIILEDIKVNKNVEEICSKIPSLKDRHGKIWYDYFIEEIIKFLKTKSKEYENIVNKEKNELFEELEKVNKTRFKSKEEYIEKKNNLSDKLDAHYENKRITLEAKFKDERRKFCKQPTKTLIESISKRSNANEIRIFKKSDGELTEDKDEILKDLFKFYQDLLGHERINEEKIKKYKFKIKKMEKIIEEKFPHIGNPITYEEVWDVIKDMKESSPGSNGLSIGFFKKFFPLFGHFFVEILNDSEDILPDAFNETIIKLIMKNKEKIKTNNDLRPISLTNFEYRIFTKVLANRLRKVCPMLFLDYQTCSVNGRRINDGLNLIKDMIYDANLSKNELYLVSIDQKKAFDSISHNYMFALLDHLNINSFITNSIKRIYTQSFASLVVDQYIYLDNIFIMGGIKQGCALSMNVYTMVIEELIARIHCNLNIKGYEIKEMIPRLEPRNEAIEKEVKSSIYADDTEGILRTKESIDPFFEEFKIWGEISGASMNEDKTKILAINSKVKEYRNIKFVDSLKLLGIVFDKNGVAKDNLENCLKKVENTLSLWNNIRFNLIDKITVLRTFALSKLWYLLNFMNIEETDIKRLETLAFNYIWNGKRELIKRKVLYCDFRDGGLNMVCIRAKIQMIYIRNLLYIKFNRHRPQYQFSIYWMKFEHFREYIENFNISPTADVKYRPIFYQVLLENAKKFKIMFDKWVKVENENRMKLIKVKNKIKILNSNFLKNPEILKSKFIYNMFLEQHKEKKYIKLPNHIDKNEEPIIFLDINKLNSSNIRLVNYKLLYNALPTNFKFKNKYDNECFMCKKKINEDCEHIFIKCERAREFYEYVRHAYLHKKNLPNSLDLLEFKRGISEDDYRALSCFVYSVWRVRNMCKHNELDVNLTNNFKIIFNKWLVTLSNG